MLYVLVFYRGYSKKSDFVTEIGFLLKQLVEVPGFVRRTFVTPLTTSTYTPKCLYTLYLQFWLF